MQSVKARSKRASGGRIVAVFGVLVLGLILAGIAAGAAFIRSIPPLRDMSELRADLREALVIVQDRQDLVLVSARGRSAPLLELARKAITPGGLARVQF